MKNDEHHKVQGEKVEARWNLPLVAEGLRTC